MCWIICTQHLGCWWNDRNSGVKNSLKGPLTPEAAVPLQLGSCFTLQLWGTWEDHSHWPLASRPAPHSRLLPGHRVRGKAAAPGAWPNDVQGGGDRERQRATDGVTLQIARKLGENISFQATVINFPPGGGFSLAKLCYLNTAQTVRASSAFGCTFG